MKIKFSHNYHKLHGQNLARLIHVGVANRGALKDKFIEYDTTYFDVGKSFKDESGATQNICGTLIGHYPLPPGDYIVLVFLGNDLIPFTTARPYGREKLDYYKKAIGEMFEIEVLG